jgi:general L-amino acid transport system permease protein
MSALGTLPRSRWRPWLAQGLAGLVLAALAWVFLRWGLWRAEFRPDAQACQALAHAGACWGVIPAKGLNLLFGHYPQELIWRPALWLGVVTIGAAALWRLSAQRPTIAPTPRAHGAIIAVGLSAAAAVVGLWLMGGGAGLTPVASSQWGGLPLTLVVALGSYAMSWPLALALALARRAAQPWLSWPATAIIEVVRGVPLVTLLFMAAFILPRLTPQPDSLSLLARAMAALTLFSAAYLAEVLRAGLQTVPIEQQEAAKVLGLGWWGIQRRVVLPQATRAVLPALTGHAIGLLKDSSLAMVIGLHELTGGLSLSLGGDPMWRPFYFEAYLFVGLVYGLMCWGLAVLGRRMEARWVHAPG